MASEKIHMAMDLKEAASLKGDPFQAHLQAADKEELVALDSEVEGVLLSERPTHDKLEKLMSIKDSLGKAAHVQATPEDAMWRSELNDAVREMDQTA